MSIDLAVFKLVNAAYRLHGGKGVTPVRVLREKGMSTTAAYLEYSDAEHRYFADGREFVSVTQVLDRAGLISPFCKDEEARFRGSKVHEFCASDDIETLDLRKVPVDIRGYLRAWRAFRRVTHFTPTLIEHRVDCQSYGYSGRLDRFGSIGGQKLPVLLDIKTSKTGAIADYVRLQLAAYCLALDPKGIYTRMAVSLMPDGTFRARTYSIGDHYQDRAEWLKLLEKNNGHS